MAVEHLAHALLELPAPYDSGENRKLNETSSAPGMMLLAPVPA